MSKSKYGVSPNGWDSTVVLTGSCHDQWKDISKVFNSLISNCSFVVGNGKRIPFWEDVWLGTSCLKDQFPRLYNLSASRNKVISR